MSTSTFNRDITVRHDTGRAVRALVFGSQEFDKVVVYSHGFPASANEAFIAEKTANKLGLTIVAIDRPGYGESDWYGERRFEDWALDVKLVTKELGVDRFAILGVSGGTPSAVAAAALCSEQALSLTIVSGLAPIPSTQALQGMNFANRAILSLGKRNQRLGRLVVASIARLWKISPVAAGVWFMLLLPRVDRKVVTNINISRILRRAFKEAFQRGIKGAVSEYELFLTDWSGLLKTIEIPIQIWHGDKDSYVPLGMASMMHSHLKDSTLQVVQGGGHFMIVNELESILRRIVEISFRS